MNSETKNKKLNLVLDLDETLIKCIIPYSEEHLNRLRSNTFYLCDFENNNVSYCVFCRPYLFYYLLKWSNCFNLYIYTYSYQDYCNIILENIKLYLPSVTFKGIWSRNYLNINDNNDNNDNGTGTNKVILKKLENLKLDPSNTIIIDDNVSIWLETSNVINIKPYFGPLDLSYNYVFDDELLKIDKYLNTILHDMNNKSLFKNNCFSYILNKIIKSDNHNHNHNLNQIITNCNEKYRQGDWIYNDCNLQQMQYILKDGICKLLPQIYYKPYLQKIDLNYLHHIQ